MLKVTQLYKSYSHQAICRDFSFELVEGEIVMLTGTSGSGKTTLLRMINYLEKVDSGTIAIDGVTLVENGQYSNRNVRKEYQQKIGLVFQDFQLFPHLTVIENILFAPVKNYIASRDVLIGRARQWLERFGLTAYADVSPNVLSGGQKQRVAIIRAMMLSPRVLCFDEPTSALDYDNTAEFVSIVNELQLEGTMLVIVTHDQVLIDKLSLYAKVIPAQKFINGKNEC